MTDNLFAGGDQPPQIDPNKNYLEELVGETKKFKDAESLARGKYEADLTVEMMKSRLDELRTDYTKLQQDRAAGATLQELKDLLVSQKQSDGQNTPPADGTAQTLKPEDIEKLIDSRVEQREASRKEQDNLNSVQLKLRERYGSNYQAVLAEQRDILNLTDTEVNLLARRSPEAFFRIMKMDEQRQDDSFQSPPRNVKRNDNFSPTASNKRTWTYYQNLKKQDRNLYYSPKVFNQMLKDAEDLGESFKDGDYKQFGD